MNNDFSRGPVWRRILVQSVPLMLAQLVQLLYNVVDRVYLGHLGGENSLALTGVGLIFPVVTLITAFSVLFGNYFQYIPLDLAEITHFVQSPQDLFVCLHLTVRLAVPHIVLPFR